MTNTQYEAPLPAHSVSSLSAPTDTASTAGTVDTADRQAPVGQPPASQLSVGQPPASQPVAEGTEDSQAPVGQPPVGQAPASVPVAVETVWSQSDQAAVLEDLGRPARGVAAVAARCVCGRPLVVMTEPRLPDGTPFPTTFYLTSPVLTAACSTLEAEHLMVDYNQLLADDPEVAAQYLSAHQHYLARRSELGEVEEIAGISAGGMPTRVKCLHALVGHSLAAGPGVNPIGDLALAELAERGVWSAGVCRCAPSAATPGQAPSESEEDAK